MTAAATLAAGATLTIDLDAIAANYRRIEQEVAPARVAGVVKADGYGLGAAEVSAALAGAGCRTFFVALLGEAIALRPSLPNDAEIFVLNGLAADEQAACASAGAIPVLNSLGQLDRWASEARRRGRALPAALQVDSGMARLGLPKEEVETLPARPAPFADIDLRLVMSHLACADEPDAAANAAQHDRFARIAARLPDVPRSLDNSAGAFLPRRHGDLVRAGIALYGGAPHFGRSNPMTPVVSLEAPILQLRMVPAGDGVGYGLTSVADRPRRIATIGVGYADGWPRALSGCGAVFVGGHRAPIAGRVSMDSMMIDVTDLPAARLYPDAPVQLIGPSQSIDAVAADAGTIAYEILTRLGRRYTRLYRGSCVVHGKVAA